MFPDSREGAELDEKSNNQFVSCPTICRAVLQETLLILFFFGELFILFNLTEKHFRTNPPSK